MSDESPDLSPRSVATPVARPRRRWGVGVVLAVLLAAAAFVVFQGLSEATVYFCNADEVGVRDDCDADAGRFRIQGTVDEGTITRSEGELDFTLSHNGATVPVRYRGAEPSDLFQEGIAVVVEGRLTEGGQNFSGDRILVKHSSEYREENPERVPEGQP